MKNKKSKFKIGDFVKARELGLDGDALVIGVYHGIIISEYDVENDSRRVRLAQGGKYWFEETHLELLARA